MKTKRDEQIEALAEDLGELYISESGVDVEAMVRASGITLSYNHYGDGFDGALEHRSGKFHIYCNLDRVRAKRSVRARFTLAHELGHFHIDEHRTTLAAGAVPMHASVCARPDANLGVEREADLFASHFLMPRTRVRKMLMELMKTRPGMIAIQSIADAFDVSMQASAIRCCEEGGLLGLVMWRTDLTPWSMVCLAHLASLGQPRRLPELISIGTATFQALQATTDTQAHQVYRSTTTAGTWFVKVAAGSDEDIILTEEAMKLGEYGTLTILRIPNGHELISTRT